MKKIISFMCVLTMSLALVTLTFGETTVPIQEVPSITIIDNDIELWNMIEFTVQGVPTTEKAWIGLYEYIDPVYEREYGWSDAYVSKIMLKNLGSTPYFEPSKRNDPQKYIIAMFDAYGFDLTPLAVSEVIQVGAMFHGPNKFLAEEKEAAQKHELLIMEEMRKGTYEIKHIMNKGECNPYITDDEVAKYQAFLASDTILEFESKNIKGADGLWTQIGPSSEWLSYGDDYVPYNDSSWDTSGTEVGTTGSGQLIHEVIMDTHMYDESYPGPSVPTKFTIDSPATITYMDMKFLPVTDPKAETVSIINSDGVVYGPWKMIVEASHHGNDYSIGFVELNQELAAGTYTVKVSNNAEWLYSEASGKAGMTFIESQYIDFNQPVTSQSESTQSQPAEGKGKIFGIVINDKTNQGIPNMEVVCYKDGYEIASTVTDASGTYNFELDAGIYDFECTINNMDYYGVWDLNIEAGSTVGYDIFVFVE